MFEDRLNLSETNLQYSLSNQGNDCFSEALRDPDEPSIYLLVRKMYFTHEKMTFSYNENCQGLCHIDLDVSLGYTLLANMLSKHSERTRDATSCPF